ncbi:MAG: histidinol-phosphate transaminase, partial [Myxococcales bacterium]|nr:histidinol-phosphate transaminase [Myxococcales bacterium]
MSATDVRPLVAEYIETLMPYQPGKPIEELQRELGLDRVIKLASNENAFGPSPAAVAAVARVLTDLHRYPDGSGFYLKRALAAHYDVDPAQLIIGNGSNEIIELAIRTFMGPGDHLLTSATTFVVYRLIAQAAGRGYREVPLAGYDYDLDAMAAALDPDTRMVFIANPNNPTGACFDAEALDRFLARVPNETIVVLDEAYAEFADPERFEDGIAIVARRPRTIVLRTFSKAYGLPGLRVGFGISSPELVGYMNRVRQPFNVNSLAQVAAIAALDDTEHLERTLRGTRAGREKLSAALTAMGLEVVPSQANFLLIDLGRDGVEVFGRLLEKGVIVRAMAGYGLR